MHIRRPYPAPLLALLLALSALLIGALPARAGELKSWLCYFGPQDLAPQEYQRFDLVVFDLARHPLLASRKPGEPLLLAAISAGKGEIPTLGAAEAHDLAFEGKTPPAEAADIRSARWQDRLVEVLVPQALAQGFDGVLLDGLDAALGGGAKQDAELRAAALAFLARLRKQFPYMPLAMNRGLAFMPEAARSIDYLVLEELSGEYDFVRKEYRTVRPHVQQLLVAGVRRAQHANPKIKVLSLDYAPPDQPERVNAALGYARGKGFVPYVATPELDRVFTHGLR